MVFFDFTFALNQTTTRQTSFFKNLYKLHDKRDELNVACLKNMLVTWRWQGKTAERSGLP